MRARPHPLQFTLLAGVLSIAFSGIGFGTERSRPNIVLILADDLSWSDLGCYGHPWHDTPHLDRMAQQGMRFTQAYAAAPICSASRASIQTGRTTARLHFEFVTKNNPGHQKVEGDTLLQAPPFTLNLPLSEATIAERLAHAGYETAFFGKWHLNAHYQRYLGWSPTHGPLRQGYQIAIEDFGSHPYSWGKRQPEPITEDGGFPDDSMIARAVRFIRQPHPRPYFMMASQFYVHTPVKTSCQWLLGKYEQRVPKDALNRERRVTYAAFVEELDHRIGRLLNAIDESEQAGNTLVLFTSDNGGHPEFTANAPWRGSKWNLYEGGIRAPLIARWPNHVEPGTVSTAPVIGYDLLPTCLEAAREPHVEGIDGLSFLPALQEQPTRQASERTLLWHFPYYHPERGYKDAQNKIGINDFAVSKTTPQSALRRGRYKLLYFYETEGAELYDLVADPGEQHDLSGMTPDVAKELKNVLLQQLQAAKARFPTKRGNIP